MTDPLDPEAAILSVALGLPASQRATFLEKARAGDAALRRSVEDCLKPTGRPGDFSKRHRPQVQRNANS